MGYDDFDGFDYDDEPRGQGNGPADLRKAYNQLKKELKEKTEALEKATGQISQRNLKDVLADKGLRPGLARVIAREDVDLSDPKAIDSWLEDAANQEDFGFSLKGATDGGAEADTEGAGDQASEYANSLQQFQNAGNGALPPKNAAVEQGRAQIKQGKTLAEIQAALTAAASQIS